MRKPILSIVAALATVVCGVLTRGIPGAGALGGILYTLMIALLVVALRPTTSAYAAGLSGFLFSVSIELLQLTDIPRTIVAHLPLARWVLGSTFNVHDLGWYAVGGVVAVAVCWAIERAAKGR